jgi:hypothetical protein
MAAFLGFLDGKYHIPACRLRQVPNDHLPGSWGAGCLGNPGFQGFFFRREIEYNSGALMGVE